MKELVLLAEENAKNKFLYKTSLFFIIFIFSLPSCFYNNFPLIFLFQHFGSTTFMNTLYCSILYKVLLIKRSLLVSVAVIHQRFRTKKRSLTETDHKTVINYPSTFLRKSDRVEREFASASYSRM